MIKEFVIITGLSGAGKSNAMKIFEDMGYFCIDNLPAPLIPKFAELCQQSASKISKVALVIDVRGGLFLDELSSSLAELGEMGIYYRILFFEAADDVLINRFKEARRNHPLSANGTISQGLALEREVLQELRDKADKVIDTSRLRLQELRHILWEGWGDKSEQFSVSLVSFGFKHGIPLDLDLMMDVRFLPNPYYDPDLKDLTGRDEAVQRYVMDNEVSQEFLKRFADMMLFLLPKYIEEGKHHLAVGIGCTGGQHRSVTIAIKLGEILKEKGYIVGINHREIKGVK